MNHRQKTHLSPCTRSHVGGWYDLTGGLPAMATPLALYDAGGRADAEPVYAYCYQYVDCTRIGTSTWTVRGLVPVRVLVPIRELAWTVRVLVPVRGLYAYWYQFILLIGQLKECHSFNWTIKRMPFF